MCRRRKKESKKVETMCRSIIRPDCNWTVFNINSDGWLEPHRLGVKSYTVTQEGKKAHAAARC